MKAYHIIIPILGFACGRQTADLTRFTSETRYSNRGLNSQEMKGEAVTAPPPPEMSPPSQVESDLAPEATEPGVISGASLGCSETSETRTLSCYLKDDQLRTIHVSEDLARNWTHVAADGSRSLPKVSAIDDKQFGTLYTVNFDGLTQGEVQLSISVEGKIYNFRYEMNFVLPEEGNEDILSDESDRTVHQGGWVEETQGRVAYRMINNFVVGDGFENERDSCLLQRLVKKPGGRPSLTWKFTVKSETLLSLYMSNPCGLQFGTSIVLIDGPVNKRINLMAGSNSMQRLFSEQPLPAGSYTVRVQPGSGDGLTDDFSFDGLIWTVP